MTTTKMVAVLVLVFAVLSPPCAKAQGKEANFRGVVINGSGQVIQPKPAKQKQRPASKSVAPSSQTQTEPVWGDPAAGSQNCGYCSLSSGG
jgi:hypothetical protein